MPSTRREASRTTAKASASTESSGAPLATFWRSSGVLAASASSPSFCIAGSSALTDSTVFRYCLRSRSLRLPKMALRAVLSTGKEAWKVREPARERAAKAGDQQL